VIMKAVFYSNVFLSLVKLESVWKVRSVSSPVQRWESSKGNYFKLETFVESFEEPKHLITLPPPNLPTQPSVDKLVQQIKTFDSQLVDKQNIINNQPQLTPLQSSVAITTSAQPNLIVNTPAAISTNIQTNVNNAVSATNNIVNSATNNVNQIANTTTKNVVNGVANANVNATTNTPPQVSINAGTGLKAQ